MAGAMMEKALEIKEYVTRARRRLHENPELSLCEFATTEYLKNELREMGVPIAPLEMPTGVVAVIRGEKPGAGPVTAIRADIDALPIEENTNKPYASKTPGAMHACGHDGHAAVLLGVAKLLSGMKNRFAGTVKLVFQPAEEGLTGAENMLKAGAMDNPKADNIVALHAWPPFQTGDVGVWPGRYMASADKFVITVKGKSGHGARPYKAVNPIVAACQTVTALQNIVSSEIITSRQAVLTVCRCNAGSAFNIIPDQAVLEGTVRCLDEEVRREIKARLERTAEGTAAAFGCCAEVAYTFGVPVLTNDPQVADKLLRAAETALGKEHIKALDGPVMGAEDFSNFVNYVGRGALMRLGVTDAGAQELVLHNSAYDFNDEALATGIAVMVQYVLDENGGNLAGGGA